MAAGQLSDMLGGGATGEPPHAAQTNVSTAATLALERRKGSMIGKIT